MPRTKTIRRTPRAATTRQLPAADPTPSHSDAPERPELRAPMREEDPRVRAARRAAELRDHGGLDEGGDEFYIPEADVPDGWEYEWKRVMTLGATDPSYEVATAQMGWEPVPASRHPNMMPQGSHFTTIDRKGLRLMERPKEICDAARAKELRKARSQVAQKEEQLAAAPQGQFGRTKSDGTPLVKVGRSYEPMAIPQE